MSTQTSQSGFGNIGADLPYDFSSPFFTVAMVSKDGERIPLWEETTPEKRGGTIIQRIDELGLRSFPYVTSVSINMRRGGQAAIEAQLEPPYEEGLKFINSPLIETQQNKLQVQFGYFGGTPRGAIMSPRFEGLIQQPTISLGESISISLVALDSVSSAAQTREGSITKTGTRLDLISELLRGPDEKNPLPFILDAKDALKDSDSSGKLNESISFTQRHLTYYQAVMSLCRQSNCWLFEMPESDSNGNAIIKLVPRRDSLMQPPKAVLVLMGFESGELGPFSRQYPILSVSSSTGVISNPIGIRGIRGKSLSSKDREEVSFEATDESVAPARIGSGDGVSEPEPSPNCPGVGESGDGGGFYHGDMEDPDIKAEMEAEFENSLGALGIPLDVETFGMPDILPMDVVQVRGLGEKIDYNYGVMEVTHSLDSSGFITNLKLKSNVLALERGLFPESPPNTLESQGTTDHVTVISKKEEG